MGPHIPVLAATAVPLSLGMHRHSVQRPEMPPHAPNLVLKDLVIYPCLESALPRRRRRHVHRRLPAPEDYVRPRGMDHCGVERRVCDEGFHCVERACPVDFGGLIFARRDEVAAVGRELQIRDLVAVHSNTVQVLAGAAIPLRDLAILMPRNDDVPVRAPRRDRRLGLTQRDCEFALLRLRQPTRQRIHPVHHDAAQMAHALLGDAEQVLAVVRKLDALDRRRELPGVDALAGADVPELDGVVGGAGGEQGRVRVGRDGPQRALVAFVRAHALAVGGEPGADGVVLADGEDEVAVGVVANLGQGALVAGYEDGAHGCVCVVVDEKGWVF